jgi:16S rRNA (adenine1518-N6/adenine1519-N6)-dimethyltransferase
VNHRPRKRFGQHFLEAEDVLAQMVSAMTLRRADAVLEIGPGGGTMTQLLQAEVDQLRLVEIDRDLAAGLIRRFPAADIVVGDILRIPARMLFEGAPQWRVVGNLPYNISTPLLGRMLDELAVIRDMHFLLQREVVSRLAAQPGTKAWGRLSVMAQLQLEIEPLFDVEPHHFRPPPKVVSSFVRLLPRQSPLALRDPLLFKRLVAEAFQQRRKRLNNALQSFAIDWRRAPVDAALRPDAVDLKGFVDLTNYVAEHSS